MCRSCGVSLGLPKHFGILDVSDYFWSRKGHLCDPYNMGFLEALSAHAGCAENYQFSKLLEPSYPLIPIQNWYRARLLQKD